MLRETGVAFLVEVIVVETLVVDWPATCPIDLESLAVDWETTESFNRAIGTQQNFPLTPSADPGVAELDERRCLDDPAARSEHASAAAVPEVGRVLRNRYILERLLGSGGMGTVFKALDLYRCDLPADNRHVAIKFLNATVNRPRILSKLRREFHCAQALAHRNIVKVYELDRDGDLEFFTMEYLEGEALSSTLQRSRPFAISSSYAWEIVLGIGEGLVHAHSRNVVHGDLKPQNIMITNSGELRILDFGASHGPAPGRSNANEARKVSLTPAYASCELLEGQEADPRDDLYALACVAYEVLAGMHPFQGRRSTEARYQGLTPRWPPGLTRQQWQTLAMGLAWPRSGRSISVRDWVARLDARRAAA